VISAIDGSMLAASDSPVVSIIVKATLILAFALIAARLTRRSRASLRHAILAAAFGVLLVLPIASTLAPPFRVGLPVMPRERIEPAPWVVAIDIAQPAVTPHAGAGAAIAR